MRYRVLLVIWLLTDVLLFMATYALAYFIRVGWIFSTDFPFSTYMVSVSLSAPVWLIVLATTRTFGLSRNQTSLRNGAYITYAGFVGTALVTLTYYFAFTAFFSRMLLIIAWVLHTGTTWAWHITFDNWKRRMLRKFPPAFPTLIVGVTRESRALIADMQQHKNALTPVAVIDGYGVKDTDIRGVPVRGKLNKIEDVLREKRVTHLIQCAELEQSMNLLGICRQHGIHYMLLPSVLGIVERDERIETLAGHPVTVVSPKEKIWWWLFQ